MRTRDEVAQKLEEVYEKRLKLRIKRFLKRGYRNCVHNNRVILNGQQDRKKSSIVLCFCPELKGSGGTVHACDSDEKAENCRCYQQKWTRANVEEQFVKEVADPKICGQKEPKVAVLLWILHGDKEFPDEKKKANVFVRLWRKIWKRQNGFA